MPVELYPLLSGLFWAFAVILFKRSSDHMSPTGLNLFKSLVALLLFCVSALLTGDALWAPTQEDILWLMASGGIGVGIADTLYFFAITKLGASRAAIINTSYAPFVVLFSFLLLDEHLKLMDFLGGLAIVLAIPLASPARHVLRPKAAIGKERLRETVPRSSLTHSASTYWAVLAALSAMACMAGSIVVIKPTLDTVSAATATAWRLVGGIVVAGLWTILSPQRRRDVRADLRPQSSWKFAVPAAVLGSFVALFFWVAGFKHNPANIAGVLSQTSSVFVVLLAVPTLKEPLTPRKMVAVTLGFAGSLLVLL